MCTQILLSNTLGPEGLLIVFAHVFPQPLRQLLQQLLHRLHQLRIRLLTADYLPFEVVEVMDLFGELVEVLSLGHFGHWEGDEIALG